MTNMKHSLLDPAPPEELKNAIRRFESGHYNDAGLLLLALLEKDPSNRDVSYMFRMVERKLAVRSRTKPTLIWQMDPARVWEAEWLRTLLGNSVGAELIDKTWSTLADPMIVVDNRLVPEKISYYRAAFEKGHRIVLIHLSDEAFRDDYGVYRYCDAIIRNYHTERLAQFTNIFFLPLGYKADFTKTGMPKPAAARKYLWSFAGDNKKLTRAEMLSAMGNLTGGHTHLSSGFGSTDALPTDAYRALLDETVFAPAPSGWSNLETFRVYEALEAGCIPIVEKRPKFDYFTTLLGAHPMPTVEAWVDAVDLINQLQQSGKTEHVRMACMDWWRDYKSTLTESVAGFVSRALE